MRRDDARVANLSILLYLPVYRPDVARLRHRGHLKVRYVNARSTSRAITVPSMKIYARETSRPDAATARIRPCAVLGPAPPVGQPWGDPPGASTCNDHAAFSSGCGPYLVRMIHGASDCPIANDGALQRLLVGGLGPAPAAPPRRGSNRQAVPHARHVRLTLRVDHNSRDSGRATCQVQYIRPAAIGLVVTQCDSHIASHTCMRP